MIIIPNPNQEPPASTKAINQDLRDIDVFCTFKINIESQNLEQGVSKTSAFIQIKNIMPNPI